MFLITLNYKVSLEEIDAHMKEHVLYLNKYYKAGNFVMSGRQVPRRGGIIIATGNNKAAIKKIISEDPLIKLKLATAKITEFLASQKAKNLEDLIK